ncbi:hypothetical protein, conserved in T. vivax [Trypanosoma vivax Y486]|uniref:Uncharacterized protein n=1 Tax=Trypanosoma vivax (strain Y486) TaxID=1055687 RepID=F9WTH1_TRYVY|nr:hypothetical protein, conserved in T. vivax [Trypanosoma vivax Y486]|eukprot:CCD20864.1 hypothetical protein, conserved in T. vivax [Trypanosoma vivax Y486]
MKGNTRADDDRRSGHTVHTARAGYGCAELAALARDTLDKRCDARHQLSRSSAQTSSTSLLTDFWYCHSHIPKLVRVLVGSIPFHPLRNGAPLPGGHFLRSIGLEVDHLPLRVAREIFPVRELRTQRLLERHQLVRVRVVLLVRLHQQQHHRPLRCTALNTCPIRVVLHSEERTDHGAIAITVSVQHHGLASGCLLWTVDVVKELHALEDGLPIHKAWNNNRLHNRFFLRACTALEHLNALEQAPGGHRTLQRGGHENFKHIAFIAIRHEEFGIIRNNVVQLLNHFTPHRHRHGPVPLVLGSAGLQANKVQKAVHGNVISPIYCSR